MITEKNRRFSKHTIKSIKGEKENDEK